MNKSEYHKCEECQPGLPPWMATFSDMVTLLLTFFVLLLSLAKTESSKYEAAVGSIRNAFGGNILRYGEVIQKGKSPDNSPTMLESEIPVKPFPIDFLTTEGFLDKLEINRESDEVLKSMKKDLSDFGLTDAVQIYEMSQGIKVTINDKIYFNENDITPTQQGVVISVYEKIVNLLKEKNWILIVEGHADFEEEYIDDKGISHDAFSLSSLRAQAVTRSLITRGVHPSQITTVFYGDSRPRKATSRDKNRRVEFIIRKRDLSAPGYEISPQ